MPSNDDLLFAEHVVKAGFLTQDEIEESLSVQKRMEEMGVSDSLRSVLVKRGVLREADAAVVARNAGLRSGGEPIPGYTLEARIGTGAMGSVYKAWQKGMKRHVAIKILRRDLSDDPRQVERLQREASLVGKLDHPNIVRGLDSGETDGLVWFVMELVDGETLRERITRLGALPPEEAIRIARQVAEALEHAATHGIVHRDVKPGNILVGKDGQPRLTDYGLAKGESDDALTQLDATLGTPQYISPEQARNPRDADIRSDIYSLGATLYAMLTSHPPFAGETMAATLTKVLYERPAPLAEEAPGTPPALAYVVERMMAKDRRHRYQTPAELLRDLRALEEGRLVVPHGFKGDIGEFVETQRHRRLWLVGVGLLVVAVTLAAGVLAWDRHAADVSRRTAAAHELESLRRLAGPRETWDGDTVQKMVAGYERLSREYAGTPAAEEAYSDLKHWAAQETELKSVNALALRAGDPQVEWPKVIADATQRLGEMRDRPDASVARARLAALLAERRDARDRHAAPDLERAKAEAATMPLEGAAQRLDAAAEALRAKYYGAEPSALADDAKVLATRFREATGALDRAFDAFERPALRDAGLERGDFRSLDALLQRVTAAAMQDVALSALLASLPPAGSRVGAVLARRDLLRARLSDASAAAWEKVRRDAEERRGRRDYEGAAALVDAFAARALDAERDKALALADDLRRVHRDEEAALLGETEQAADRYFDAVRRRDYARARETLEEFAALASSAVTPVRQATELVEGGRRLLDLIEKHVWTALRDRLAKGGVLDEGLHVRAGSGYVAYRPVRDVRLDGRTLSFAFGDGQRWTGSLDDVALDDVIRFAGLEPSDPERALTLAAIRLLEFQPPADPVEGKRQLAEIAPLFDTARAAPELVPLVARLSRVHEDLVRAASGQAQDAEASAQTIHAAALAALEGGRYETAFNQLQSLLTVRSYWRTEYVRRKRDEIVRERDSAALGRQTANYAIHFPGAAFAKSAEGSGELFFDFEDAALATAPGRKLLALVEGRTEIDSRPAVLADRPDILRPGRGPAVSVPLVLDHVLAWRPAAAGASPREFPVSIASPFEQRKRIEVSFLYRSEAPFFFAVSVGGATAGVLSAPDEPYGGRGIEIWSTSDLDRPDKAFDERHRTSYLAKHPETLKKEGDRRFFCFEPGRTYRVLFVKDERKASLWIDGQLRADGEWHAVAGPLEGKVVLASYGPGEVDDLRITGTLDPEWLRGR